MKQTVLNYCYIALAMTAALVACQNPKETASTEDKTSPQEIAGRYGDTTWNVSDAYDPASFNFLLGDRDSLEAVLTGEISSVCQAKGCWMKMDVEGMDVLVRFTDYGYFVPMNSTGHKATVKGMFYVDSVSVDQLKEYALDAKKPQEEIDAITEPEERYTFMADGVVIE